MSLQVTVRATHHTAGVTGGLLLLAVLRQQMVLFYDHGVLDDRTNSDLVTYHARGYAPHDFVKEQTGNWTRTSGCHTRGKRDGTGGGLRLCSASPVALKLPCHLAIPPCHLAIPPRQLAIPHPPTRQRNRSFHPPNPATPQFSRVPASRVLAHRNRTVVQLGVARWGQCLRLRFRCQVCRVSFRCRVLPAHPSPTLKDRIGGILGPFNNNGLRRKSSIPMGRSMALLWWMACVPETSSTPSLSQNKMFCQPFGTKYQEVRLLWEGTYRAIRTEFEVVVRRFRLRRESA